MEIHEQPTLSDQDDGGVLGRRPPILPRHYHGKSRPLSRRALLGVTAAGVVGAGVAATAGGITVSKLLQPSQPAQQVNAADITISGERLAAIQVSGIAQHKPITATARVGHLLRRAGFGAQSQELASYTYTSYEQAVERLLNYDQISDDEMENRLKTITFDMEKLQDQQRWWLLRMAWTQRPLLEKMTLFWHNFLTSSYRKVGGVPMRMLQQNRFFREHAFDTFDTILQGITRDPAMLVYLDLTRSRKSSPNENYARELMELFTLGVGHYTQQDIKEAAAALTGWHVYGKSLEATYQMRDRANRTIYFLGQAGNFDDKDIIRILTNHEATPWFLSRKLYTFFVNENPSNADLQPLVDAYVKSNHSIRAVMKALLLSPQFSDGKAYRSRVKSPVEFVVGAYRALDAQGQGGGLPAILASLGQSLFDPPNVAGWPGYKLSAVWLNSGTWMTRMNFINTLLTGSRSGTGPYKAIDLQGIVDTHKIKTPEHFVNYFAYFLLDGVLDQQRRTQLLEYFTSKEVYKNRLMKPVTLTNGQSYPLSRVRGTVYLMMASPEYQLN
jgi:uncharacterized protein (DUF1800 family)